MRPQPPPEPLRAPYARDTSLEDAYEELLEQHRALAGAEGEWRRALTELEVLYAIEQRISEADDLDRLLADVMERACAFLHVEACAILLLDEAAATLHRYRQSCDPLAPQGVELRHARRLVAHARAPIRRCRDEGGAIADSLFADGAGLLIAETFSAPLFDGRSAIGMVQLVNRRAASARPRGEADDDWMLRVLSLVTGQLARAIVVRRERAAGERAQRLSLLGHSVAAIVHDLRTPMTAIAGFTELMAAEDDAQKRKQHAERVARALAHMEALTHEVLVFAQGNREVLLREVSVGRFVDEVREMLLPETARYGVRLEVESTYDGVARFDESKLKRVLFNLARNACEAMQEGGVLTWRVAREAERLVFECSDDGPGIAKEMEGRLFASFATHGKAEGTGLGLAMAKKIVDAHCGTIESRSWPGEGATFRIELPC